METQVVSLAIMADPRRRTSTEKLYAKLVDQGLTPKVVYDENHDGEWVTCIRAIKEYGKNAQYHVILQDDAIISENFRVNLENAIKHSPEETLISLYLGQTRPYPEKSRLVYRDGKDSSWIKLSTLYWGVGFAMPTKHIEPFLEQSARDSHHMLDRRIGRFYQRNDLDVLYTNPSIVDHDYKLGTLIKHNYVDDKPRIAYNYRSEPLYFNNSVYDGTKLM